MSSWLEDDAREDDAREDDAREDDAREDDAREDDARDAEPMTPTESERTDEAGSGIPWMPLFFYLAAVLFYLLYTTGGDLHVELPPTVSWLFVPVFLYLGVGSLATGRAPLHARIVARETHPKAYWLVVGLFFALALLMLLAGFGLFS